MEAKSNILYLIPQNFILKSKFYLNKHNNIFNNISFIFRNEIIAHNLNYLFYALTSVLVFCFEKIFLNTVITI